MLRIHFSNRTSELSAALVSEIARERHGPFDAATVVVPGPAWRRHLSLAMADTAGVCAQVNFDFLAPWLWRQIARLLPGVPATSPFSAEAMVWRLYAHLGDESLVRAHPRLAAWLAHADAVMRLELAEQLAGLFDQYLTYRPDWLAPWQTGAHVAELAASREDEAWQAALWCRLATDLRLPATHPASDFVDALERLGPTGILERSGWPRRVHLFALPAIAPLHASLLARLGDWIDVDLWVFNPCAEYWFELVPPRRLAALRRAGRAEAHEVGNRLLATWGRQTQAMVDTLIERAEAADFDDSRFVVPAGPHLLARWQTAMLELRELEPGSIRLTADDRSVEVHSAHSLGRQVEILHDQLLSAMAADPTLRPADVVVLTPAMERVAPLVEGVFGTAPPERRLPFAITGRPPSQESAPARALLDLLTLASGRVTATEVFALLQQGIVARRFDLHGEALDRAHEALREGGFRWGLDAEHRGALGLPPNPRHTLADAFDRLFLAHALPDSAGRTFGPWLAAGAADRDAAQALGCLWSFGQALAALHRRCGAALTPQAWAEHLLATVDRFLLPEASQREDLRELQTTVRALADRQAAADPDGALPFAVQLEALRRALEAPARGAVPTGAITVAPIAALRGLPWRMVCIVGLDDGVFPSAGRPPEFDLMADRPRRGDRQRRQDERNLFLDVLLSATDRVWLGTTGRSVRDNARLPPSVLVSEWLDTLVPAIADDPSDPASLTRARQRLVIEHPLQAFSPDAFDAGADPRIRSHRVELAEALRAGRAVADAVAKTPRADPARPRTEAPDEAGDEAETMDAGTGLAPFFRSRLPAPGPEWREPSLDALRRFFLDPAAWLLRERLRLDLGWRDEDLQDDEPLVAGRPDVRALSTRLLNAWPEVEPGFDPADLAHAGSELPTGPIGDAVLRRLWPDLKALSGTIRDAMRDPPLAPRAWRQEFSIASEPWALQGTWHDLRAWGRLRWQAAPFAPRDLLGNWIEHLALCIAPPPGVEPRTRLLAPGVELSFQPVDDARGTLAELLGWMRLGHCEPLPFFPRTSWTYVDAGYRLATARPVWSGGGRDRPGESARPSNRIAWRGIADPLGERFDAVARSVFDPLRRHLVSEGSTA